MTKTFFPELHKMILASPPHPANTYYKVSVGLEKWGSKYLPVVKVQMVYNDKISGRKSPSYPLGTDDYMRVSDAINDIIEEHASIHGKE